MGLGLGLNFWFVLLRFQQETGWLLVVRPQREGWIGERVIK